MSFSRFTALFCVFIFLLALGPVFLQLHHPVYLIPRFWHLFIFFSGFTFLTYTVAFWRMQISNKASGQILLASVVLRLLFCMILAFVYLYNMDVNKGYFMLNFFYLYLSHTVFEIYCLLCNLRT